MNGARTLATAGRVLRQLGHDPRSIILMLVAPSLFSLAVGLTGGYGIGFGLCAGMALLSVLALRGGR